MSRPRPDDKLSESELIQLRLAVERGVTHCGSAAAFAARVGVRAPVISQARHGRLVVRTECARRILEFELDDQSKTDGGLRPRSLKRNSSSASVIIDDPELATVIARIMGRTKRGRRDLLQLLKAAASLRSANKEDQK